MIYLILGVLSSASLAIALRLGETFCRSRYGLLLGNYISCLLIAWILLPDKHLLPEGGMTALAAGSFNGVIFLLNLIVMQQSIQKNGAVLSTAFSKMGVLLPVLVSIFALGEKPTLLQIGGMILAAASILILNLEKSGQKSSARLLLFAMFFLSGTADGMSKVFERIGERQFDVLFLFYTFLVALIPTAVLAAAEKKRTGQGMAALDLSIGLFAGIPNYFSCSLLLAAVTKLPAYIAYPCFNVGTILVVSVVSVLILKDRMSRRQVCGCGLILAALVLLNI